ncbi:histidine kinase [Bordetella sp. N]|nr:histidine kinase [Bordetella sp. N]
MHADVDLVSRLDAVPNILDVVCQATGMGFAAVARVTSKQWIACQVRDDIAFGLAAGGELELESTICHEICQHQQVVVIDHVALDPLFRDHHTPRRYGFQSYISMPIFRGNNEFFGTLCAIDPHPRQINTPHILKMFRLFADLIGRLLDSEVRVQQSEAALVVEREDAKLREQFIAVLGHDLRNPLGSIAAGAGILRKRASDPAMLRVVSRIEQSVNRMAGLIDDVLDFARGRLGAGISINASLEPDLGVYLSHVVDELSSAHPERDISLSLSALTPVYCDIARVGQLLSNLLGNALTHGAADRPIEVSISQQGENFSLTVSNQGKPIKPQILAKLFEPFFRGEVRPSRQGLGLGLYICHEIARAHHGTLHAQSELAGTVFSFTMPNRWDELVPRIAGAS